MLSFDKPFDKMLAVVRLGGAICLFGSIGTVLVIGTSLPPALKMFCIMTSAASHAFLLCLGCVEAFNQFFNNGAPLIARQLFTVAGCAVLVGCLSGFVFGAADVENDIERLSWEQWVTASLCMLSGAAIGHANAVASNDDDMEIAFDPLPMDEAADAATTPSTAPDNNNNNNNTDTQQPRRSAINANRNNDHFGGMDDGSNSGPAPLPQPSENSGVSLATINFNVAATSPSLVRGAINNTGNTTTTSTAVPTRDW